MTADSEGNFDLGKNDGNITCTQLTTCYNEVVYWKRNLFRVPIGKTGDAFVSELTSLFNAYATTSSLESIALYAAMTMPHLLLQRPTGKLKHKEIVKNLERHLSLWKNVDFLSLLSEGRSIQSRLKSHRSSSKFSDNLARKFSNLVFVGDIKGAIRLLSDNDNGRVLSLDSLMNGRSVKEILLEKHPPSQAISPCAIYSGPSPQTEFHPIIFDSITPDLIRSTALQMNGSSGPSGLDASVWKHLSTSFNTFNDLCSAIASLARRISTNVDPTGLYPFLASRLIAIDKLPGVHPIGIGEVVRRIVGKAVLSVVRDDILEVAGTDQLCAGQP